MPFSMNLAVTVDGLCYNHHYHAVQNLHRVASSASDLRTAVIPNWTIVAIWMTSHVRSALSLPPSHVYVARVFSKTSHAG